MNDGEPSRSAMSAAVARGTHRLWDAPPWIIDDPFALVLVGPRWPEYASGIRSLMPADVFRRGHLFVQIRSRYCARGSELALSYNVTREHMDAQGFEFLTSITPKLADQGEPVIAGFAPSAVEALVSQVGLNVVDHPTSEDLWRRYCTDRSDPTRPYTVERLITVRH